MPASRKPEPTGGPAAADPPDGEKNASSPSSEIPADEIRQGAFDSDADPKPFSAPANSNGKQLQLEAWEGNLESGEDLYGRRQIILPYDPAERDRKRRSGREKDQPAKAIALPEIPIWESEQDPETQEPFFAVPSAGVDQPLPTIIELPYLPRMETPVDDHPEGVFPDTDAFGEAGEVSRGFSGWLLAGAGIVGFVLGTLFAIYLLPLIR